MEVVVAFEGGKVLFGEVTVVVQPVQVNTEQLMAGKGVFGSSNKDVFGDAK